MITEKKLSEDAKSQHLRSLALARSPSLFISHCLFERLWGFILGLLYSFYRFARTCLLVERRDFSRGMDITVVSLTQRRKGVRRLHCYSYGFYFNNNHSEKKRNTTTHTDIYIYVYARCVFHDASPFPLEPQLGLSSDEIVTSPSPSPSSYSASTHRSPFFFFFWLHIPFFPLRRLCFTRSEVKRKEVEEKEEGASGGILNYHARPQEKHEQFMKSVTQRLLFFEQWRRALL